MLKMCPYWSTVRLSLWNASVACAVLIANTGTTRAQVIEVSAVHVKIVANANAARLVDLAERLEHFHTAMVKFRVRPAAPSGRAGQLTVYVARRQTEVADLYPDQRAAPHLQGFYLAGPGDTLAVVAPTALDRRDGFRVAVHEYVHHYMAMTGDMLVPEWVAEGAAGYYSSASFIPAHDVLSRPLGASRYGSAIAPPRFGTTQLLCDPAAGTGVSAARFSPAFYTGSRFLYSYLVSDSDRARKLEGYIADLRAGLEGCAAASRNFGDLTILEAAVQLYSDRGPQPLLATGGAGLTVGPIRIRKLSRGENALLSRLISLRCGQMVEALTVLQRKRYPRDAGYQTGLATIAAGKGEDAEVIATANAALSLDPSRIDALLLKGNALLRQAAVGTSNAHISARRVFEQTLALEPDQPQALIAYYRSYKIANEAPPAEVVAGLERAVKLAPFDASLAVELAQQRLGAGNIVGARAILMPIARNLGSTGAAPFARYLLDQTNPH